MSQNIDTSTLTLAYINTNNNLNQLNMNIRDISSNVKKISLNIDNLLEKLDITDISNIKTILTDISNNIN